MAQAPLDRSLARPTDAPPLAHAGPAGGSAEAVAPAAELPDAPLLPPDELPRHVAIIMDGNRRWARARGKPDFEGHAAGVEAIRELLRARGAARHPDAHAVRVQPRELGPLRRGGRRPVRAARRRRSATRPTSCAPRACGSGSSAGSRSCRRRRGPPSATRSTARPRAPGSSSTSPGTTPAGPSSSTRSAGSPRRASPPDAIDERTISEALYTGGLPDPDLVIRTGGEQRISNFLIWQSAYAELVFTERLWPDFGPDAFDEALLEFARRTRRFGR